MSKLTVGNLYEAIRSLNEALTTTDIIIGMIGEPCWPKENTSIFMEESIKKPLEKVLETIKQINIPPPEAEFPESEVVEPPFLCTQLLPKNLTPADLKRNYKHLGIQRDVKDAYRIILTSMQDFVTKNKVVLEKLGTAIDVLAEYIHEDFPQPGPQVEEEESSTQSEEEQKEEEEEEKHEEEEQHHEEEEEHSEEEHEEDEDEPEPEPEPVKKRPLPLVRKIPNAYPSYKNRKLPCKFIREHNRSDYQIYINSYNEILNILSKLKQDFSAHKAVWNKIENLIKKVPENNNKELASFIAAANKTIENDLRGFSTGYGPNADPFMRLKRLLFKMNSIAIKYP